MQTSAPFLRFLSRVLVGESCLTLDALLQNCSTCIDQGNSNVNT